MNFDGAVNAKAEVFLEAFKYSEVAAAAADGSGPSFVPGPDSLAQAEIARARLNNRLAVKEKIAVGVLRPKDADTASAGLRIGLFVQHKKLLHHPVVEAARRIARDEVEIVVTGRARRHAPLNAGRCRPLRMGGSVGHHRVTAGTIGCFAVSRQGGGVGILSNNHVLANTNRGGRGDVILQPGRADCRNRGVENKVAKLESYIQLDFGPADAKLVDCAFALLDETTEHDGVTLDHLTPSAKGWQIGEPEELLLDNVPVKKVGRTTGYTEGMVEAVGVDNLTIQMVQGARPKFAVFHQQIVIRGNDRAFSKPGDSGSLICTDAGRPTALLFAGTESGGSNGRGITYANPIHAVLDALDIDIYTYSRGVDHG